jgi:predicted permease
VIDVLNLALPYFGLIAIGYLCARYRRIPDTGLAWMGFFILYVALPALFYRILAQTPFEQLNNAPFILATTLATLAAFVVSLIIAVLLRRDRPADWTIAALAGSYGNIGYMGPGLALAMLGPAAAAPVALIFCFDTLLLFSLVPMLMAVFGSARTNPLMMALDVVRRIVLHPLMIATALGVASAAFRFEPPVALDRLFQFLQNAAAPCALFTLGVTVGLRLFERVPWDVPALIPVKLLLHPFVMLLLLSLLGPFDPAWAAAAVLMAALPPALNVFVFARQYGVWVEQASGAVLAGTLLSVLTLTTVMWLVKNAMLPLDLLR